MYVLPACLGGGGYLCKVTEADVSTHDVLPFQLGGSENPESPQSPEMVKKKEELKTFQKSFNVSAFDLCISLDRPQWTYRWFQFRAYRWSLAHPQSPYCSTPSLNPNFHTAAFILHYESH